MQQWGFYFNQNRCLGCKTCTLACKNWNEERRGDVKINVMNQSKYAVPEGVVETGLVHIDNITGENALAEYRKYYMKENWRRIETYESGTTIIDEDNTFSSNANRRYISISCNHCSDPACVKACPMGAIYKESKRGLVLTNPMTCISCGRCKSACPWGCPQFYSDDFASFAQYDPLRPRMSKCSMCLERIDEGLKPACVAACWNRALDAGPMEELIKKYGITANYVEPEFPLEKSNKTKPNYLVNKKINKATLG